MEQPSDLFAKLPGNGKAQVIMGILQLFSSAQTLSFDKEGNYSDERNIESPQGHAARRA